MKGPLKRDANAGSLAGVLLVAFTMASCGGGDTPGTTSSTPAGAPPAAVGTTVQVSATATDPDGDQLHYRWAATEGVINNVDAPNTTWTVPPGSGLQFAYVLVSDEKGGYTERRAAVLTLGQVTAQTATAITPPAPSNKGFVWGTLFYKGSFGRIVYLPGVTVTLSGTGGPFTITTDMKGDFFVPGLAANQSYTLQYAIPGGPSKNFTTPA